MPTLPVTVVALLITGTAGITVSVSVVDPVPPALVAEIVTVLTATAVGVPLIRPVIVLMVNPVGSPVAPKEVGERLAVMLYEKTVPTLPLAVPALVMAGAAGFTVRVNVADPVPPAFVANRETMLTADPVGVPLMMPVVEFNSSPAGRPVAAYDDGVLLARMV